MNWLKRLFAASARDQLGLLGLISGPLSPPTPPRSSVAGVPRRTGRGAAVGRPWSPASTPSLGPLHAFARQADLAFAGIDLEDLDLDLLADFDDLFGVLDLVVGQLRNVQQAFQAVFQADENAEIGQLGDGAGDDLAGLVLARDVGRPRIFLELLEPQGDAAAALIDRQHLALDGLALFDHFAGMADLAGPRHVADVQQAVDPFFDLDEGTVIGQVADGAGDQVPGG